ncbi:serine O-acetyltransferase [Porticoccaceae bacterium]|nr:serine O-acetyltransferase [Porticoccaceae bacterium]
MKSTDPIWDHMIAEAKQLAVAEPMLADYFESAILQHQDLESAVSHILAESFVDSPLAVHDAKSVITEAFDTDLTIAQSIRRDIEAAYERDAACQQYLMPLIYFKGFQALQLYRVAHWLWLNERVALALFFQNSISERFTVDIHPAAKLGSGIMIDHATGLVIGETAVVGDDVSILHSVTLGGSGCQQGDRHPKIGNGVLLAAGAKVLGNITVGDGVKVGAGSLVLESVPAHVTVAGVPAKIVGAPAEENPALEMDHYIE